MALPVRGLASFPTRTGGGRPPRVRHHAHAPRVTTLVVAQEQLVHGHQSPVHLLLVAQGPPIGSVEFRPEEPPADCRTSLPPAPLAQPAPSDSAVVRTGPLRLAEADAHAALERLRALVEDAQLHDLGDGVIDDRPRLRLRHRGTATRHGPRRRSAGQRHRIGRAAMGNRVIPVPSGRCTTDPPPRNLGDQGPPPCRLGDHRPTTVPTAGGLPVVLGDKIGTDKTDGYHPVPIGGGCVLEKKVGARKVERGLGGDVKCSQRGTAPTPSTTRHNGHGNR